MEHFIHDAEQVVTAPLRVFSYNIRHNAIYSVKKLLIEQLFDINFTRLDYCSDYLDCVSIELGMAD